MTKHTWIALLIFGIIPVIILFLCREPIINNIKLFYETKESKEPCDQFVVIEINDSIVVATLNNDTLIFKII
jgi:hypothetical protein